MSLYVTVDSINIASEKYGKLENGNSKEIKEVKKEIENYLESKNYTFSTDYLNLDKCSKFQKKVLKEEFKSEFGTINTYKDIALKIGREKSARAVGNALRNNPFPIIIPCHRTIRSDKNIGGFGGLTKENNIKRSC